jgi:YD repeat-containing protein
VDYTYDDLGRIVQETETVAGETHSFTYDYDPAGRLSQVTRDGAVVHVYTYDGNGNRLGHTLATGAQHGTYDAQDRSVSYSDPTYTHTLAGDRLTKTAPAGTTTYDYDAAGNLRAVELPDGATIDYLIDGLDRRIGRQVYGVLQQG